MGRFTGLLIVFSALAAAQPGTIRLIKIAGGLSQPTHIAGAGDGSGRLFVVEQRGRIRIVRNGAVSPAPFLDISERVSCCGERGLLSVAFPPGFAASGRLYAYYTNLVGDIVVARYQRSASTDSADPASETVLLTVPHRQFANHNGGQLAFAPDGSLFIGTGDGGGGGDPFGNGQNPTSLLGKLLRMNVEHGETTPSIRALGLRNPWRFSFDRATGGLYIADVGQNTYEEINYQPATDSAIRNYGWNVMEGFHCYQQPGCNQAGLTLPVAEYNHSAGDCSVTGGFVYRGTRYPNLQGVYFFGDYCSGRVRTLTRAGAGWESAVALQSGLLISSFGEDDDGEIYLADQARGDLYLLAGGPPAFAAAGVVNAASYEAGISPGGIAALFGSGLTPASGIVMGGNPLPRELLGASVQVNGIAAPLFAIASANGHEQINFQVPYEIPAGGKATVVVVNNGAASLPVEVDVLPAQPGIFTTDGVRAAALHGVGLAPITAENPASPGEIIVLYGTGLGPVENPPGTGVLAPQSPLSHVSVPPLVTIAGQDAAVGFAGLAPLFAGLFQLNVRVPAGVAAGDRAVVISSGGRSSKSAAVAVGP
jgi:uncharacterized protein (TIGR03437 family)